MEKCSNTDAGKSECKTPTICEREQARRPNGTTQDYQLHQHGYSVAYCSGCCSSSPIVYVTLPVVRSDAALGFLGGPPRQRRLAGARCEATDIAKTRWRSQRPEQLSSTFGRDFARGVQGGLADTNGCKGSLTSLRMARRSPRRSGVIHCHVSAQTRTMWKGSAEWEQALRNSLQESTMPSVEPGRTAEFFRFQVGARRHDRCSFDSESRRRYHKRRFV